MTLVVVLTWILSLRMLRHLPIQSLRLRLVVLNRAQAHRHGICRSLTLRRPLLLLHLEAVLAVVGMLVRRLSLLGRALASLSLIHRLVGCNRPPLYCVLQRRSSR